MIGEWVAQNPGEAIGVASSACVLIGWLLVKWLGDKFEPKRPELSEKQRRRRWSGSPGPSCPPR